MAKIHLLLLLLAYLTLIYLVMPHDLLCSPYRVCSGIYDTNAYQIMETVFTFFGI